MKRKGIKARVIIHFRTTEQMKEPICEPINSGRLSFTKKMRLPFFPRAGDALFLKDTKQESIGAPVVTRYSTWHESGGYITVWTEPIVVEGEIRLELALTDLIENSNWKQDFPDKD